MRGFLGEVDSPNMLHSIRPHGRPFLKNRSISCSGHFPNFLVVEISQNVGNMNAAISHRGVTRALGGFQGGLARPG